MKATGNSLGQAIGGLAGRFGSMFPSAPATPPAATSPDLAKAKNIATSILAGGGAGVGALAGSAFTPSRTIALGKNKLHVPPTKTQKLGRGAAGGAAGALGGTALAYLLDSLSQQ